MSLKKLLEKLIPITIIRRSTLRKKDEELRGLKHKLKMIARGPEGIRTLQESQLNKIFRYRDRIKRKITPELKTKAEILLDDYFETYLQQEEARIYEYEGDITKTVYLPDPNIQEGVLKKTWLIQRLSSHLSSSCKYISEKYSKD